MRRFIINFAFFSVLLVIIYVLAYWLYYKIATPKGENIVYAWGDSQMYEDIDLKYLNAHTPYHFYSAAEHGAGLYDFLVFTRLVPDNSKVIIQISLPALLRRKIVDRNISAINLHALNQLRENHYSAKEIYSVIKNNIFPSQMFFDKNYLFPAADTIDLTDSLSLFTFIYAKKPGYFNDKENLYFSGIQTLVKKNCRIIAFVFPYHTMLNEIQNKSPYLGDIIQFDKQTSNFFVRKEIINIPLKENIFHDLTHLNARGAGYLSKEMTSRLNFTQQPLLIQVTQQGN